VGYPGALRLNMDIEPYASKIRFLRETLKRDIAPTLSTHPKFVTYGMDRIACRAAFLEVSRVLMNAVIGRCSILFVLGFYFFIIKKEGNGTVLKDLPLPYNLVLNSVADKRKVSACCNCVVIVQ